jgi:hypothetical protein
VNPDLRNHEKGEGGETNDRPEGFNTKRHIRNLPLVAKIATKVKSDRHVTTKKLARAHGVSTKTIHTTLQKDLNLSKKLARWVPKLLNDNMKKE